MLPKTAFLALGLSLGMACVGVSSASAAGDLVTNGGFESHNFNGWSESNFNNSGVQSGVWAKSGTYGAHLVRNGQQQGSLSQTLATVANTLYTLNFDIRNNRDGAALFSVLAGTAALFSNQSITGGSGYTHFTAQFTASSSSTLLNFKLGNGNWGLDNVSVTKVATAVPGPIAGAGLPALLGLLGFGLWRRKRAATA